MKKEFKLKPLISAILSLSVSSVSAATIIASCPRPGSPIPTTLAPSVLKDSYGNYVYPLNGQNYSFSLVLPVNSLDCGYYNGVNNGAVTILSSILANPPNAYQYPKHFYLDANNYLVLNAPVNGATTTTGEYVRSELVENYTGANSDSKGNWYYVTGGNLSASLKIDSVPKSMNAVIFAQLHTAGSAPFITLLYDPIKDIVMMRLYNTPSVTDKYQTIAFNNVNLGGVLKSDKSGRIENMPFFSVGLNFGSFAGDTVQLTVTNGKGVSQTQSVSFNSYTLNKNYNQDTWKTTAVRFSLGAYQDMYGTDNYPSLKIADQSSNYTQVTYKSFFIKHQGLVKASENVTNTSTTTSSNFHNTPASYASLLTKNYSPSLSISNKGMTTNRGRYLISTEATASASANYLSVGSGYAAESGVMPSTTTYSAYFSKMIQVVANSTDKSGFYRIDSHLHPNYSLDCDVADNYRLKFRNNLGVASPAYGYVVFSYDPVSHLLRAEKRYIYNLNSMSTTENGRTSIAYSSTYTEDTNFSKNGSGYYVKYSNGIYTLVSQPSLATMLYFQIPSDDYSIPSRLNPANTTYVSNPPAPYSSSVISSAVELGNAAFNTQINTIYQPQVAKAGSDTNTKTAADQFLATIPTSLAQKAEKLRYAPALYTAFRDAALAGKLMSASTADGVPGQNLVPFVYFTNEKDASGSYHPFMNVVTYGIPGSPEGLLDIPGPPFFGAGSSTTPVTRYSNIGYSIARIPMKDYGQVSKVTDNLMLPQSDSWKVNLVTDLNCGSKCPAYDNYNYASIADMGILIDGSILFPLLNNALIPSQWKGELSTYGCHVGQGGGGPHCHSDGFNTGQKIITLYNDNDYENQSHPPLIGFGYDGVALFGTYRDGKDTTMAGYNVALDTFGGHNHDGIGYHYHSHVAIMPDSYNVNINGTSIIAKNTPVNVLLKGAWAGNINSVPYFGYRPDFKNNKYLGGK
jgi:hypothetical protein